jgi:hypothetical protein
MKKEAVSWHETASFFYPYLIMVLAKTLRE